MIKKWLEDRKKERTSWDGAVLIIMGLSLTGKTFIVTVAASDWSEPSNAVKEKLSVPWKFG